MSDQYEPSVNLYLSYLRIVDPEAAKRLEKVLRDHEEDSHLADIAYNDLGEALRRMAVDLHHDKVAAEHVADAVAASPVSVFSSDTRLKSALEYLARSTDHDAFMASGLEAGKFLERHAVAARLQGEPGHLSGIALLRAARKAAESQRKPIT